MKLKFTIILLLFGVSPFLSCTTELSTNQENNFFLETQAPAKTNKSIGLSKTELNTKKEETMPVLELRFHQLYLKIQIDSLNRRLAFLEKGTDEYENTQIALNDSLAFLGYVERLIECDDESGGSLPCPGPLPIPPGPLPCLNCEIIMGRNHTIFVSTELQNFSFSLQNQNGEEVANLGTPESVFIEGSEYLSYPVVLLNIAENDNFTLKITKFSDYKTKVISYRMPVEFVK